MKTTKMAPRPLNGAGEAVSPASESDFAWFLRDFDRIFNMFPPRIADFFHPRTLLDSPTVHPAMDVREMKDHWRIDAELPGVDEKDVDVTFSGQGLIIKAEKPPRVENKETLRAIRMQRVFGSVHATVPMPKEVDPDKVEARMHQGVLTVILPKTKKAKQGRKKIAIHTG